MLGSVPIVPSCSVACGGWVMIRRIRCAAASMDGSCPCSCRPPTSLPGTPQGTLQARLAPAVLRDCKDCRRGHGRGMRCAARPPGVATRAGLRLPPQAAWAEGTPRSRPRRWINRAKRTARRGRTTPPRGPSACTVTPVRPSLQVVADYRRPSAVLAAGCAGRGRASGPQYPGVVERLASRERFACTCPRRRAHLTANQQPGEGDTAAPDQDTADLA